MLGNDVLQDRRLSFTARGLLSYLLSLPDGAREDVRTLADRNPGVGRRGIAKALDELIAHGYYGRRTLRDDCTGQISTSTYVTDVPDAAHPATPPAPVSAGAGRPGAGKAGSSPEGEEHQEKEPTHPATGSTEPQASAPAALQGTETMAMGSGERLLASLASFDGRLALSMSDVLALAPLLAPWRARGLTDAQVASVLVAGLPSAIHSPRALLADRLRRKLPAPRGRRAPGPATQPLGECSECRDPLPRGTKTGTCRSCRLVGQGTRLPVTASMSIAVREHVSVLRGLMHPRLVTAS
ncbi:helix-turn-helix domain-containing protein [Streptomyces sp. NPDC050095]|uniref:helix-turn-helix domain-containing protein n=1 Tax=unclassified Streptomyces TaxID=2593676 RepID=UPI0034497DD1